MLTISKEELIEVTGGAAVAPSSERIVSQRVEFDSREIKGGELFVALKGEKMHGHQFVKGTLERGASMVLVEDAEVARQSGFPERAVVVPDTLAAFSALAQWWRERLNLPLVAITGSVGKTTVKEMVAAILLQRGAGTYSLKSHNNHTGVPYTICRIQQGHHWAVIEMGMNHAGEIEKLARIAAPDVGVITKIAPAHIEHFATGIEGIADAKCEILRGLRPGAPLIANGDDEVLRHAVARHLKDGGRPVRWFGGAEDSSARLLSVESHGLEGLTLRFILEGREISTRMSVMGQHNAMNAVAAASAAKSLLPDLTHEEIAEGLRSFKAPLMRLNLKELTGGRRVIDDSYNANPASMRGVLELGRDLVAQGLKVGLILGDMLELGTRSEEYHRQIGQAAAAIRPEFLIGVGTAARWYLEEAKGAGVKVFEASSPDVAAHAALKLPFDLVIVKGSRGIQLDQTVKMLFEREGVQG